MIDTAYAVIFRGDIVMGQSLPDVKQRLKQIFKVDDARIDNLFKGKPVPLKTHLTQDDAEKYRLILRKAGAVVVVEAMSQAKPAPTVSKATASSTGILRPSAQWRLAPVGSRLSDSSAAASTPKIISLAHLTVAPQLGNLLKDNERPSIPEATINANSLDWDLSPLGEALLRETEKAPESVSGIDPETLSWGLTPVGESLLTAAEKAVVPAVTIDTSALSVAEMGGDLLNPSEKKQSASVEIDTSHLNLVNDDSA
jgi:hypothetical protein